jgi:hypothetical protein
MAVFHLKYRDTRPGLLVYLLDPDGTPHSLVGTTAWSLHVWLSDGTKLARDMTVYGDPVAGALLYTWDATDWTAPGGLDVSPTLPLQPGVRDHRMEYEVVGPGDARLTFPNNGYDTLRVTVDIGQWESSP